MRMEYRLRRFMQQLGARLRRRNTRHPRRPEGAKSRFPRMALLTAISLAAFFLTMTWINGHLRPVVTQLATARIHYLASKAINDAIDEKINIGAVQYDSIIHFEKDVEGQITALKTDISAVNRLRTDIVSSVLENIENIGVSDLGIPVGNVLSGDLFSGRGPKIRIKIVPVGTAKASFENVFSSAGINQTRHQIMMHVQVEIDVLLLGFSAASTVGVDVNLAETVIVGSVPNQYTNLDGEIFKRGQEASVFSS